MIRILLADDHAILRDAMRALLEAQGDMIVVGAAADGQEAVRLVQQQHPDVAILDIGMPELNGIEATLQIRQIAPETRIVILSMHSTAEHVHRALEAGADGYVLKEEAGVQVVDAVRMVHAGHRFLSKQLSEMLVEANVEQTHTPGPANPLERLSKHERRILQLVVEGNSSAEIAGRLSLSRKTVETYRSRMMNKLGIHSLPALIRFAVQNGLSPLHR